MAVTKVLFWISFAVAVIVGSEAAGELRILHSPDSLSFSEGGLNPGEEEIINNELLETDLKDVFAASLGLSVGENSEWNSLQINDPFSTPEAVVEVYIDGILKLDNDGDQKLKTFPVVVDEYEPDTFNSVKNQIKQRFSNGPNKLVDINFSNLHQLAEYAPIFGNIELRKIPEASLKHLQYNVEEDYQFLKQLEALNAITEKVKSGAIQPDNFVDLFFIRFSALHYISDFRGHDAPQTKEAKKLLGEALLRLSAAFVEAYSGRVLVTALTTDVAHTRAVRQAAALDESNATQGNMTEYSSDYAAVFNIILWVNVVFVFTLVAIVYALADMDPGRDSIIYRMTSTRMKKDN